MKKPEKNALEWTVFAVSSLLVLALVGVLTHAMTDRTLGPADLRIELGAAEARGGKYMVPVHVRNVGGTTAEEVSVEVVLRADGAEREKAELVFQFIPAQSDRQGWAVFGQDPRCCEVAARPVGFGSP